MQAWSARQTKTHSPIIMQSVKSTQVQKPVLQTATEPATVVAASAAVAQAQPQMAMPLTLPPKDSAGASSGAKPPPSYEFSLQQQVIIQFMVLQK